VSRIVQVVREYQCQFAVKGGGHGNHAGASSIEDGLLIDMSRITSVALSADESIAGIGAGARWIDVYEALEERGLTVVGGRSSTVGVGGFTLGGIYFPKL
jgi:FAD/FMN-containing dehydrogenase